jgi:phenylacetate-coenzyme A ligase PaaK-like adenylate-forming protein
MDTAFFRHKIESYWGVAPLEGYGGTELVGVALQGWNRKGMTFLPDCNFLEFIPEQDFFRSVDSPNYQPSALTMDQVRPGVYELVITNFHGGVFVRYRTGDLVEIVSMQDRDINVALPQMVFHARADGVIDVAGFTRLTEKAIWRALEEAQVPYVEWAMRKEYLQGRPALHLYVELRDGFKAEEVQGRLSNKLRDEDPGYGDLETMLGLEPLKVTRLSPGAFTRYQEAMRAAGADLAHMKPPRINPSDAITHRLLNV